MIQLPDLVVPLMISEEMANALVLSVLLTVGMFLVWRQERKR